MTKILSCLLLLVAAQAQTEHKLKITAEGRVRYEDRSGNGFGKDPDLETGLVRTRLGLSYTPVRWLKFSGMVQDARAPWYGTNAPNTVREGVDLQESYIELFPGAKRGFGMTAGRMMMNYGEARLLGSPQWGNLARTYDHVRVMQRTPRGQFELLFVSPVKIRIGEFNRPVLGDRVWGTYNSFPNLFRKNLVEAYFLRHDQNRPGGFTGVGKLATNTWGTRMAGPLPFGAKYSIEGALQNGKIGAADHRGGAWFSSVTRRWPVGRRTLDLSAEYKFASGSGDSSRSGTFDQLYPANHDKFGHQDLFGWRNIHNARSLATLALTKNFAANLMYDSFWLASARDSLYSGSGKSIARSANGSAGRHVGQEADLFFTYKYRHFTAGAGYGHFSAGEFVRKTTPGVGPTYLYLFHTFTL